jgi:hypothetical protein
MAIQDEKKGLDRRQFLTRVSGGALGASAGIALMRGRTAEEAKLERRNEQPGMAYKPFGKTNLNISRLTYGCIQLQDDRLRVLEAAVERGVNLVHIDEGYNRGAALPALSKLFEKPGNRDKVFLALKGDGSGVPANIDDTLKTLHTDHVDIICAPITQPDAIRASEKQMETFEALKKAGKARFLNLTTHSTVKQGIDAALEKDHYSTILAVINLNTVGLLESSIKKANEKNVGIMAMKTSGRSDTPDKVVPALLGAGVTTILRSLSSMETLEGFVKAIQDFGKASAASATDHATACADGNCTLCGLCEGCPNGVAIQDVVRNYTYYYEQHGLIEVAAERYAEIPRAATGISCQDCGRCEEICPMHVPTRRIIREAHERLGMMA